MSQVLVEVTRGPLVECVHRGDIAVVDVDGNLLYHAGDPYKITYMRSSAKPLQTMEVILSGAAERFNLTDKEISVMCASHYAEEFHLKTVEEILNKIGVTKEKLLCGITTSLNMEYALKIAENREVLTPLYNNCSGKHAGMLAVCVHRGYNIEDYNSVNHPVQIAMKNVVANMCGIDEDNIIIGTDGCTVPVFGMPLYNMALGYAKLSNSQSLEPDFKNAADRVCNSIMHYPEMISGTGGFCSELVRKSNGRVIGKLGSDGVYCLGIKGKNIGIAIKIEDGSFRALPPSVMQALEDIEGLSYKELESLNSFKVKPNKNNVGNVVGGIKPVYHLIKNQ